MGSDTTTTCPFRSHQDMAALAGTATLVCLQFSNAPEQNTLYAHAPQLMTISGVLRCLLLAHEEATAAAAVQQQAPCSYTAANSNSANPQSAIPQAIPLDEPNTKSWETVLSMLYPQTMLGVDAAVATDATAAEALLLLADKYDMPMVTERCKQVIASRMAADAEFLTPSTVFPWLYVFSRFDMQDRVDSCISYIADNKLEIPEECFASVKPKHLQQLHVKLQDILQQELADARHDAKDALMRERTARRECSDAKDRLEAAERKSQYEIHHVHHQLPLKQVAMGHNGEYVILWNDGTISWSSNVPESLDEVLRQCRRDDVGIDFVSFSSGEDAFWFVADSNGKVYSNVHGDGEGELYDLLFDNQDDANVQKVWFCPMEDSSDPPAWAAVMEDGTLKNSDYDVRDYEVLDDCLEGARQRDGIKHMAFDGDGGYFVCFQDGMYQWHRVLNALRDVLHQDDVHGWCRWVELGSEGRFVALCENCTVWCGSADMTKALIGPSAPKA